MFNLWNNTAKSFRDWRFNWIIFSPNFNVFTLFLVPICYLIEAEILTCVATFPAHLNPPRAECDTWTESLWSSSRNTVHFCKHTEAGDKQAGRGNLLGASAQAKGETPLLKHTGGCVCFLERPRLIIRANWRKSFLELMVRPRSARNVNKNAAGGGDTHSDIIQLLATKWEQMRPKLLSDKLSEVTGCSVDSPGKKKLSTWCNTERCSFTAVSCVVLLEIGLVRKKEKR